MNTQIQTSQISKDQCRTAFYLGGRKVENTYRCNHHPFSPTQLWNIHRSKRDVNTTLGVLETVQKDNLCNQSQNRMNTATQTQFTKAPHQRVTILTFLTRKN